MCVVERTYSIIKAGLKEANLIRGREWSGEVSWSIYSGGIRQTIQSVCIDLERCIFSNSVFMYNRQSHIDGRMHKGISSVRCKWNKISA